MTTLPRRKEKINKVSKKYFYFMIIGSCLCGALFFAVTYYVAASTSLFGIVVESYTIPEIFVPTPRLNIAEYDRRMYELANVSTTTIASLASTTFATSATTSPAAVAPGIWPVKTVYPKYGAILPFNRIVAYYGNFLSKQMGVLGQYPEEVMLSKFQGEIKKWQESDPATPVMPAVDYIAITAQAGAGADGKYRARMSDREMDHALAVADKLHGIVILEMQIGQSDLPSELESFEKYLKMPQVHLALDPEFAMKGNSRPGRVIGTFDALEINYAANYLADLVKQHNLPPKILIVHRFTYKMVTNADKITPLPEVQVVMGMDGWGTPSRKLSTYQAVIYNEPVQFTGFKLFYKNDILPPSDHMMTPAEVLNLTPKPIFVQYQ